MIFVDANFCTINFVQKQKNIGKVIFVVNSGAFL